MKDKIRTTIFFVFILGLLGLFLNKHREINELRELARIASDFSATINNQNGRLFASTTVNTEFEWFVIFGAYIDPREILSDKFKDGIANKISSHGDDSGFLMYGINKNKTSEPVDIRLDKIYEFGNIHVLCGKVKNGIIEFENLNDK